jgi:hypothetical protein
MQEPQRVDAHARCLRTWEAMTNDIALDIVRAV